MYALLLATGNSVPASAAPVSATVRTSSGTALSDVYVALVAEDRPWSSPIIEAVAPDGKATWDVPPGSYRMVAGAVGFATGFGDVFSVDGTGRDVVLELSRLSAFPCIAVNASGHPITGGGVTFRMLGGGPELSVLGEEHLRSNHAATTGPRGGFSMLLPASPKGSVLVEVAGSAPVVLDAALISGQSATQITVGRGAKLRVRWRGPQPARRDMVSLLPVDVELPKGLDRKSAIDLWTRPTTGNEQQWDALPAGTYRVVQRAATAGAGRTPIDLRDLILAPGDDRLLEVALASVAGEETASRKGIQVLLPSAEKSGDMSVWYWRDGDRVKDTPIVAEAAGGTLLTVMAPCVAGTFVVIETATRIGAATIYGSCDAPIRTALEERTNVTGRVTVPAGASLPRWGVLRGSECVSGARVEMPFAIAKSAFSAAIPATCKKISLSAEGFAPVNVHLDGLKAAERTDLGTLALKVGAAAALNLRWRRSADPIADARVTAVRTRDLEAMQDELQIEKVAVATGKTDANGWIRFAGLPDDRLVFVIHAPSRRLPQISEPYVFAPGTETIVDDFMLEAPANVIVTMAVGSNLENKIEVDSVELVASGHTHWPGQVPIRGVLGATGTIVEDVPPGSWKVRATGRLKNGFLVRFGETTVDVASGGEHQVTLALHDSVYEGRVKRGEQAVKGIINLKPADRRSHGRSTVANIAPDGTFQVLLEGAGEYAVRVQDPAGSTVELSRYVKFDDPEKEVEIELPAGSIRGRVIDPSGVAVEGAVIGAIQQIAEPKGAVYVGSGQDGSFVLEGVAEGTWEIVADTQQARSEPQTVSMSESDTVEGVTLILDQIRTSIVTLRDASGVPVADAIVMIEFPSADGPTKKLGGITRADGSTEVRLSRSQQARPANIVAVTPDNRLMCEMRQLEERHSLMVPREFGEVRLIAPRWSAKPETRRWLMSGSGCAVPFLGKVVPESTGGEAMVFSKLPPGAWMYVETTNPSELAALLTGKGRALPVINSFVVEANKSTRVPVARAD